MTELLVRVGEPRKGCSCLTCGTHIRWRGEGVYSRDIRKETRTESPAIQEEAGGREASSQVGSETPGA